MWNGETQNHFHSSGKQENTLSPLLVIGKVFQDPRREAEVWSVERWQLERWKWVSLAKGGYMIEREKSHSSTGLVIRIYSLSPEHKSPEEPPRTKATTL